jgi:hypothetical protein
MILLAINKIRYSGKKYLLLERTPHRDGILISEFKNFLRLSAVNILSVSNVNCIGHCHLKRVIR